MTESNAWAVCNASAHMCAPHLHDTYPCRLLHLRQSYTWQRACRQCTSDTPPRRATLDVAHSAAFASHRHPQLCRGSLPTRSSSRICSFRVGDGSLLDVGHALETAAQRGHLPIERVEKACIRAWEGHLESVTFGATHHPTMHNPSARVRRGGVPCMLVCLHARIVQPPSEVAG